MESKIQVSIYPCNINSFISLPNSSNGKFTVPALFRKKSYTSQLFVKIRNHLIESQFIHVPYLGKLKYVSRKIGQNKAELNQK